MKTKLQDLKIKDITQYIDLTEIENGLYKKDLQLVLNTLNENDNDCTFIEVNEFKDILKQAKKKLRK